MLSAKDGMGKLIKDGYELGDKFKIIKFDIEPVDHIKQTESNSKKSIQDGKKSIDVKYAKQIDNEVKEYVKKVKDAEEKEIINKIETFAAGLEKTLSSDISKNEDKDILSLIDNEKKQIEKSMKRNKGEKEKDFKASLDKCFAEIDIQQYYIERNNQTISVFEKKLKYDFVVKLTKIEKEKTREFENKYKIDINKEYHEIEEKAKLDLEQQIAKIKEDETEICFSIYLDRKSVV